MRCDKYEYTSDRFDTGNETIDQFEEDFSVATDNLPIMLLEDDTQLLNEDGTVFLEEGNNVQSKDAAAQNEFIQSQIGDEDILDFSEKNPFAQTRIF